MKSVKENKIKVIARFRPIIDIEMNLSDSTCVNFPDIESVEITCNESTDTFVFDRVFALNSTQSEIYTCVGHPTVEDIMNGYNGTIFAFGQTGSGKTHTMMGEDIHDPENCGIIPRAASEILDLVESCQEESEFSLKCSMLEIYKESLNDLLGDSENLKIKESPDKGIYVHGLREFYVVSAQEIIDLIALGETNRTVASTQMNHYSSRSHQLFILEVSQKFPNLTEKRGILNLVDLAGSEKISSSRVTGLGLEEAKKINLSLSALGNVIQALINGSSHIPYRDSKLTRLLQESLGGNYKTALIVNCSPHSRNAQETMSTLKFAKRAKNIKNAVKVNIKRSAEAYLKIIQQTKRELADVQEENERLKVQLRRNCGPKHLTVFSKQTTICDEGSRPELAISGGISITANREFLPADKKTTLEFAQRVQDLESRVTKLIDDLESERKKRLKAEHAALQYFENYKKLKYVYDSEKWEATSLKNTNESLKKQNKCLLSYLRKISLSFTEQLSKVQKGEVVEDWDFVNNCEEFLRTPQKNQSLIVLDEGEVVHNLPFDNELLISHDDYLSHVQSLIENSSGLRPELLCFQLKKQLVQAGLINASLLKSYYDLHWRYTMIKEKAALKTGTIRHCLATIENLEETIEYVQDSYRKLLLLQERMYKEELPREKRIIVRNRTKNKSIDCRHVYAVDRDFLVKQSSLPSQESEYSTKKLEASLHVQMLQNEKLKNKCEILENDVKTLKKQINSVHTQLSQSYENEKGYLQKYIDLYRDSTHQELMRKQREVDALNELLSKWIHKYLEVQEGTEKTFFGIFKSISTSSIRELVELTRRNATESQSKVTQASVFYQKFEKPLKLTMPDESEHKV